MDYKLNNLKLEELKKVNFKICNTDIFCRIIKIFIKSISTNKIKSVISLHENFIKYYIPIKIIILDEQTIYKIYKSGYYEILQLISKYDLINFNFIYMEDMLNVACEGGHLNIVKLIFEMSGVEKKINIDEAFSTACLNGHLHIAQWIDTYKFTYCYLDDMENLIDDVISNSHIEVAKWLITRKL